MSVLYDVEHVTTYRYAKPVTFGRHRAMFLPRLAGHGRILRYSATVSLASSMRWLNDALSNAVTVIDIEEPGTELTFTFRFRGIHYGVEAAETFPLEPRAEEIPVQYSPDEWTDLAPYLHPHVEDADAAVAAWAKTFTVSGQDRTTIVLRRMLDTIRDEFAYQARNDEGTQTPGETLRAGSGTCRDFAWLMIEALRRLGFACRFVSGYIYDPGLDDAAPQGGAASDILGAGATHAWVQVYLPGAGWLNYDPTNRLTCGHDLIPVAIARHPGQAVPLIGTWYGAAQDYLGMTVNVAIRKLGVLADPAEG
jgi:transglutaminase-like putative cysteine protease